MSAIERYWDSKTIHVIVPATKVVSRFPIYGTVKFKKHVVSGVKVGGDE